MKKKRGFLDGYNHYDPAEGSGDPEEWRNAFSERMGNTEAAAILEGAKQTAHQILAIPVNASNDEIRKAFHRLIKEWHPDRNAHRSEEAHEMSRRIIAAYTQLIQHF